jgi:hypothetical protein
MGRTGESEQMMSEQAAREAGMTEMQGTHHFDGDGCAVYPQDVQIEICPGFGRPRSQARRIYVGELEQGEIWQEIGEGPFTWWHADEVIRMTDRDEVHIEHSTAHPYE